MMENKILKNSEQIGRIEGNRIYAKGEKKLGYFDRDDIFDMEGNKLAYVQGNYLYLKQDNDIKVSLDDVRKNIEGGTVETIAKCAIYILIGI